MSHAERSLAVIGLTAAALGLGATLALAPSPHAAVLHHTVVPADAVAWSPAPCRRERQRPSSWATRPRRGCSCSA
jgi:hypothetical protein